jgi:hypothetical protein
MEIAGLEVAFVLMAAIIAVLIIVQIIFLKGWVFELTKTQLMLLMLLIFLSSGLFWTWYRDTGDAPLIGITLVVIAGILFVNRKKGGK